MQNGQMHISGGIKKVHFDYSWRLSAV